MLAQAVDAVGPGSDCLSPQCRQSFTVIAVKLCPHYSVQVAFHIDDVDGLDSPLLP